MISKSTFRKNALHYRQLLDYQVFLERNSLLNKKLENFVDVKMITAIHTFLSIQKNKEPDISPLFDSLWSKSVKVIISKTDFRLKQMRHYYLHSDTELVKNKMGIPEPYIAEEVTLDEVDIILVPLLVSDKEGYRIGYGGGYYDRLLKETKALKVGLSLSPPVDEIIQREDWDIPLDYLITPFKTYNYG